MSNDPRTITVIDTDLLLFRHGGMEHSSVQQSASAEIDSNVPVALCEFSIFEIKSNIISDIIWLIKILSESQGIDDVIDRISGLGAGGYRVRSVVRCFQTFIRLNHKITRDQTTTWENQKEELCSLMHSQLFLIWKPIENYTRISKLNCRNSISPLSHDGQSWSRNIKKCKVNSLPCKIIDFLDENKTELRILLNHLQIQTGMTSELEKIKSIVEEYLNGKFSGKYLYCQRIGDLVIALTSTGCKQLLSANYKEHSVLSSVLSYTFKQYHKPTKSNP